MPKKCFESGSKGWRSLANAPRKLSSFVVTTAFLGLLLGVGGARISSKVAVHNAQPSSTTPITTSPAAISLAESTTQPQISSAWLPTTASRNVQDNAAQDGALSPRAPYDVASVERQVRARWAKTHPALARLTAAAGSYAEVAHLVQKSDWDKLSADHRGMIRQTLLDARAGRMGVMPCFAPNTNPNIVQAFEGMRDELQFFRASNYWSNTAFGPHAVGAPMTLSWSIVPDGTSVPNLNGTSTSNLRARLNGIYGSEAVWRALFRQVFARYTALSGITYVEEANDDGVPSPNNPGVRGVRGDVRIGGTRLDGNFGVLAFNYFPDAGDMVIDTADSFFDSKASNSLGFRNVVAHEHGHGLAFAHTCPIDQTKLMEPFISLNFDGPQTDELQNLQRGYGDPNEPNNSQAAATDLGTLDNGTVSRANVSIQNGVDQDFYRLSSLSTKRLSARLTPIGGTYLEGPQNADGSCSAGTPFPAGSQRNLNLAVYNASGTLVALADAAPAGGVENLADVILNNSAGPFFVRVAGDAVDKIQLYSLTITLENAGLQLDLNGPALGTGFTSTFTEDGGAVAIVDKAALVVDNTNGANLSSATLTLSSRPDGVNEILSVTPSGAISAANIIYANGVLTITANASPADYQAVLRSATYNNQSQNPNPANRTVTFVARDSNGNSAAASATVKVVPVNDAPVANPQSVTTTEDTSVPIVLGASDVDNDPLTYTIIDRPTRGTLTGVASNMTYTPIANFNGADSFTFRVNDGTVNSNTATVTLQVLAVNDAPNFKVGADQIVNANSGAQVRTGFATVISAGPANESTQTLTFTVTNDSAALFSAPPTIALNGTLTYTPAANVTGTATVSVVLKDDGGTDNGGVDTSAVQTFTIKINAAPVVDLNGGAAGTGFAANFTEDGGAVAIVDAANLTVSDSDDTTLNSATIRIVNPLNLSLERVAVTPSGAITASNITYASGLLTINALASVADYQATLRSATYDNQSQNPNTTARTINFAVKDGAASSDLATATVNVAASNDAPTASDLAVNIDEDSVTAITLPGRDPENDVLTYSVLTQPTHGTLSGTPPNLTYTPDDSFSGVDSFTYRANDGSLDSNTATVTITINQVNDAPFAVDQQFSVTEDSSQALILTGSDVEGDPITFSVVSNPAHGTLSGTPPNLTYTPTADYSGADSFTFQTNDGNSNSKIATVTISVIGVNDAPVAAAQSVVAREDSARSIVLNATDVDGDRLSYAVTSNPAQGTLSGVAPNLIYTPNANFNGADSFVFRASDGVATSNLATVTLQVLAVNDAPSFKVGANQNANEDSGPQVLAGFATNISPGPADESAQVVNFVLSNSNSALFSAQPTLAPNGTLSYTPAPNANGTATITVVLKDNGGTDNGGVESSVAQSFTITIGAVNDAPLAFAQQLNADNATPLAITLNASDIDGDALSFPIASGPQNGTLSGVGPNLIYRATPGFIGLDSFAFTVSDGTTTSAAATVTIIVSGDPAVTASDDAYNLIIGLPGQVQQKGVEQLTSGVFRISGPGVLRNDSFPNPRTVTVRAISNPAHGRFQLRNDGTLFYLPANGRIGAQEFTYALSDGKTTATAKVRLNIIDKRAPELAFDAPFDRETVQRFTVIKGRVRDRNAGLKAVTLQWSRFDGKFWNGRAWVANATELPTVVQGINWAYRGPVPKPGTNAATDLLPGRYDLRVTATDKSDNFARVVNRIIVSGAPTPAPELSKVRLSTASASSSQNTIVLRFTGALDAASASATMNYQVSINGTPVGAVVEASYAGGVVTLSGLSLQPGQAVDVQITGLRDAGGKLLQDGTVNVFVG